MQYKDYRRMGGWLLVFVLFSALGMLVNLSTGVNWLKTNILAGVLVLVLLSMRAAVLVLILVRSSLVRWVYATEGALALVAQLYLCYLQKWDTNSIVYVFAAMLGYALWFVYFTRSHRVHIYLHPEEYVPPVYPQQPYAYGQNPPVSAPNPYGPRVNPYAQQPPVYGALHQNGTPVPPYGGMPQQGTGYAVPGAVYPPVNGQNAPYYGQNYGQSGYGQPAAPMQGNPVVYGQPVQPYAGPANAQMPVRQMPYAAPMQGNPPVYGQPAQPYAGPVNGQPLYGNPAPLQAPAQMYVPSAAVPTPAQPLNPAAPAGAVSPAQSAPGGAPAAAPAVRSAPAAGTMPAAGEAGGVPAVQSAAQPGSGAPAANPAASSGGTVPAANPAAPSGAAPAASPAAPAAAPDAAAVCPVCGAPVRPSAQFCGRCGARLFRQ